MLQVGVSFAQAALGTRVNIPLLTGTREIVIPPGTQPGETIRLKGEGVPYPKGSRRGDLLVQVQVSIPRELTPKQQELLQEWVKDEPEGQTLAGVQNSSMGGPEEESFLKKIWHSWTHRPEK